MADFKPFSIMDLLFPKFSILLNSDDGEEDSNATWLESGSAGNKIYIGKDGANDAEGGFRFKQAVIPNNAKIIKAVLRMQAAGNFSNPTNLKIKGIKESSPDTFSQATRPSTRAKTTAEVDWDFAGGGGDGNWIESPDIKTIIQEIIDQPEFGNKAIALVIEPDTDCPDNKLAIFYDQSKGAGYEAQLILTLQPII